MLFVDVLAVNSKGLWLNANWMKPHTRIEMSRRFLWGGDFQLN